jgi:hypothetical protein
VVESIEEDDHPRSFEEMTENGFIWCRGDPWVARVMVDRARQASPLPAMDYFVSGAGTRPAPTRCSFVEQSGKASAQVVESIKEDDHPRSIEEKVKKDSSGIGTSQGSPGLLMIGRGKPRPYR